MTKCKTCNAAWMAKDYASELAWVRRHLDRGHVVETPFHPGTSQPALVSVRLPASSTSPSAAALAPGR